MTTTLKEAAELLRSTATSIEALSRPLAIPEQEFTLTEAAARLSAELGTGWSLSLSLNNYAGKVEVSWNVWDGRDHHKGPSLGSAVCACLRAHAPEAVAPVEAAQAVLDGAVPVAF